MRGKLIEAKSFVDGIRITPADAGKTFKVAEIAKAFKDHPRGCGENWSNDQYTTNLTGSPPRMRGKPNDI